MKASDLFVQCLENENVEYIFGLPGEELKDVLLSLRDSSIKCIITRHEQGAAFMADVYGRLTGKAGVCMSTLGPGATNLVTGVADANLDHAPLLAITAQGSLERLHKDSHQIIDIVNLFKPVTKWNTRISSPSIIPETVRKAFKIAEMEKPGATHLELPENIAGMKAEGRPMKREKVRRAAPDYKAMQRAIELLQSSRRPLILAGNGSIRKLASKQLNIFAEKTRIPVLSTFMGKGAISDKSEHSLLSLGLGASQQVNKAIDAADLILTIGYDIAELDPMKWNRKNKRIVHIDFAPAEVYEYYQPEVEVVADISNTLWQLNQQIQKQFSFPEAQQYRKRLEKEVFQFTDKKFPVHPKHAVLQLRKALPDDAIVIADVGAHKMWIGSVFPTYECACTITSNSFASMGIALPGALGAALAKPDCKVVAVTGDGGFLMNVQELETAKRLGLDFMVVIFNDSSYSLIEAKFMAEAGATFGTDFGNPDFSLLAKSFGCNYFSVKQAHELEAVYWEALETKGVSIVDILIDRRRNMELFL